MDKTDNIGLLRNLSALVDFSNLINSSLDINFILNNILLTCMGKFHTTKGLIVLFDRAGKPNINISKGFLNAPEIPEDLYTNDEALDNFIQDCQFSIRKEINSTTGAIGVIFLGRKLTGKEYDKTDLEFLSTIINIGATAIENSLTVEELKRVNRELDSKVNQLSSLFDLSKEFSGLLKIETIGKLLAFSLIGQMTVSEFAIVICSGEKHRILETKYDRNKIALFLDKCDARKINTVITKRQFTEELMLLTELGVELIVPMQIKGETKGLIMLGERKNRKKYEQTDIEFISSLGSIAIISIENALLFETALEKQRMEKDLETARTIQKNLLPKSIPKFDTIEIAAYNESAKIVGGDYYDVIQLDEDNVLIAIADVSGKGVPASLLMANLQAFLKTICKMKLPLDKATNLINDLIAENTTMGNYVTFFWSVFNTESKELTYVNAGHNPPFLIRNGKITKLKKGGMIIGFLPTTIPYESETVKLQKGDYLILYTDGITEAMDKNNKEFTDEKFEELVCRMKEESPYEAMKIIKKSIDEHVKGAEQSDDLTYIVARVTK
ncbi:protein serine/threonine phosphatase [Melioribacter roseus P3M-2]|uniref:Protein serine/threonine phosphatase n=1 Tax=Melioribacter roseus (strain DSM 23840 / JCM 17771 / VKM B-2668 / P3M-2) TaxID=1191523 RepID=I7A1J5_MELRP|nr:SpoIIE family protein phosphatase [Melioribacter roseus]AFN75093.1 protein serine/threonine phosphatase [Melioribacter roseus P3M-2]